MPGPFAGLRVVDWSTVAAGPSAGQLLAVLGAEVIKLEPPVSKDLARSLMLPFMPARFRTNGSDGKPLPSGVYHTVNRSKKAVVLDLDDQADKAKMNRLLDGADVLLTNLPSRSQKRLGFTPERLQASHPGLVFAHLQAWGDGGPEQGRPGYDLGTYYAASGMAKLFSPEGRYQVYPTSFGDLSTGLNLFVAIAVAVTRQRCSGLGASVSSSLYGSGIWAVAPHMLSGSPVSQEVTLSSAEHALLAGPLAWAEQVLGPDPVAAAGRLSTHELQMALGERFVLGQSTQSMARHELPPEIERLVGHPTSPVGDVSWEAPWPFCFPAGCELDVRAAPQHGQHQQLLQQPPRPAQPRWSPTELPPVVEVGSAVAVALAGRLLASLGMQVLWVPPEQPPSWQLQPGLAAHLRHGKRAVSRAEALRVPGAIVITDLAQDLLPSEVGIADPLFVARLSGSPAADWYLRSGMAALLRGADPADRIEQLPAHVADAAAGSALAGCCASALFGHLNGKPVGREGRVDFLELGMYLIQQQGAMMQCSPLGRQLFGGETGWSREQLRVSWPVPAASCFKTTDGQWIQNLGVDTASHLPVLLKALGKRAGLALKLPRTAVTLLWAWATGQPTLELIRPVTLAAVAAVHESLEAMSTEQFERWAEKSGWNYWAMICSVEQAKTQPNTIALNCFVQTPDGEVGSTPVLYTQNTLQARL